MSEFNQKEYINEHKKDNYKQFNIRLKIEENEQANKLLKEYKIEKADFLRICIGLLENGDIKMKNEILKKYLEKKSSEKRYSIESCMNKVDFSRWRKNEFDLDLQENYDFDEYNMSLTDEINIYIKKDESWNIYCLEVSINDYDYYEFYSKNTSNFDEIISYVKKVIEK